MSNRIGDTHTTTTTYTFKVLQQLPHPPAIIHTDVMHSLTTATADNVMLIEKFWELQKDHSAVGGLWDKLKHEIMNSEPSWAIFKRTPLDIAVAGHSCINYSKAAMSSRTMRDGATSKCFLAYVRRMVGLGVPARFLHT